MELKIIIAVYTFANVYIREFEKPICAFGHYTSQMTGACTQHWGCSSYTRAPLPAAAGTAVGEAGGCVRRRPRRCRRPFSGRAELDAIRRAMIAAATTATTTMSFDLIVATDSH